MDNDVFASCICGVSGRLGRQQVNHTSRSAEFRRILLREIRNQQYLDRLGYKITGQKPAPRRVLAIVSPSWCKRKRMLSINSEKCVGWVGGVASTTNTNIENINYEVITIITEQKYGKVPFHLYP